MHPVLFQIGSFTIYSYGACIAAGALLGFTYMAVQGKRQFGLSLDQSNSLFLFLLVGGILGGKLFLLAEGPEYLEDSSRLIAGNGFVFYGSLLVDIPIMLWFFKRHRIPVWAMLDVMAIVICLVHGCGRIGCLLAGCCYGIPIASGWGLTFTNPACLADPLNTPLFPSQLAEAGLITGLLILLLTLKKNRRFEGQLFLIYLLVYAAGRGLLEFFRGDLDRGFIFQQYVSNSQLISMILIGIAVFFYVQRRKANLLNHTV